MANPADPAEPAVSLWDPPGEPVVPEGRREREWAGRARFGVPMEPDESTGPADDPGATAPRGLWRSEPEQQIPEQQAWGQQAPEQTRDPAPAGDGHRFEVSLRGYHRGAVDRFVQDLGTREQELVAALAAAEAARAAAEQRAGSVERENRTLREHREQAEQKHARTEAAAAGSELLADRILRQAEWEADRIRAEAQQHADQVVAQARSEAERIGDVRSDVRAELRHLLAVLDEAAAGEAGAPPGDREPDPGPSEDPAARSAPRDPEPSLFA